MKNIMKSIKMIVCSMIATGALTVSAEIEPVVFTLSDGESYTPPAGKILVVRHLSHIGTIQLPDTISLVKDGATNEFVMLYFMIPPDPDTPTHSRGRGGQALNAPLIIPADHVVWMSLTNPFAAVMFHGLLVDPSDLYAEAEHEINSIEVAEDSQVILGLQTVSARPLLFRVERTANPNMGWEPVLGATINPTTDKRQYIAIADMDDPTALYRSRALPRILTR